MKTITLNNYILKLVPNNSFNAVKLYKKFSDTFGDSCELNIDNIKKLYKDEYPNGILKMLLGLTDTCIDVANEVYEKTRCKRCDILIPEEIYITEELICGFLGCSVIDIDKRRSKLLDLLLFAFDVALEIPEENFIEVEDE